MVLILCVRVEFLCCLHLFGNSCSLGFRFVIFALVVPNCQFSYFPLWYFGAGLSFCLPFNALKENNYMSAGDFVSCVHFVIVTKNEASRKYRLNILLKFRQYGERMM